MVHRIQQLKYQMDPEYLFSPVNGEGKAERAIVESYFKTNYTHNFEATRITRPGKLQLKINRFTMKTILCVI